MLTSTNQGRQSQEFSPANTCQSPSFRGCGSLINPRKKDSSRSAESQAVTQWLPVKVDSAFKSLSLAGWYAMDNLELIFPLGSDENCYCDRSMARCQLFLATSILMVGIRPRW